MVDIRDSISPDVLAQKQPGAGQEIALFTVPKSNNLWVEGVAFCNTGGGASSIRLAFCPSGNANHPADWWYLDFALAGNGNLYTVFKLRLHPTDSIRVSSTQGSVSFTLLGQLI